MLPISSSDLATPACEDAFAGITTGGDDAFTQFATADDIEAAAEIGEGAEDGEVGVVLDFIAKQTRWSTPAMAVSSF